MYSRRSIAKGLFGAVLAGSFLPTGTALARSVGNWKRGGGGGKNNSSSTTTRVISDYGVSPMITRNSLSNLQNAIARYEIIVSRGGWRSIPRTRVLVRGVRKPVIQQIKLRLSVEGFLPADYQGLGSNKFDMGLQTALVAFQKAMVCMPMVALMKPPVG